MEFWGLISWLAAGAAVGALFRWLARPVLAASGGVREWGATVALGLAGGLVGGLVATVLGFGGLAAYDPRSLTIAVLGALLTLLLDRWLARQV